MMLKAALPVEAVAEPLPVHRHSLGFEATADIVETFARAEAEQGAVKPQSAPAP